MTTAVFPAAGASTRMNNFSGTNKNLLKLAGEMVLLRSIKTFSQVERVNFLIVVVGADEVDAVKKLLSEQKNLKPWVVTVGGSERQYSIANGLKLVPPDADTILVHDAARPLITKKTIEAVIDAAETFGGAIAAVPAKDTIKIVGADGFVRFTPARRELVAVQTPQGFKRDILLRAYEKAAEENFLGTDDSSLVERLGVRIKIVPGEYSNLKITTPEDIFVAETFLRSEN
ncbi:MAG: 2-C-methyl-D-erythritol 4-phosphate cytidylyltransferase, partial [Selenomonadaceae bacterium]|nr:2-C-methyl-D-erythritol 4-phosphate cytidylyltransferase [Selenomonadaceae bacterium]